MKYYIAGKIGEEKPSPATLAKFKEAEDRLLAAGYEVFNPTTSGYGKLADEKVREAKMQGKKTDWYQEILKLDLDALSFCDGIYLLPDYKSSGGAMTEYHFAQAAHKKILFSMFVLARFYLEEEFAKKVCKGKIDLAPGVSLSAAGKEYCMKNIDRVWLPL